MYLFIFPLFIKIISTHTPPGPLQIIHLSLFPPFLFYFILFFHFPKIFTPRSLLPFQIHTPLTLLQFNSFTRANTWRKSPSSAVNRRKRSPNGSSSTLPPAKSNTSPKVFFLVFFSLNDQFESARFGSIHIDYIELTAIGFSFRFWRFEIGFEWRWRVQRGGFWVVPYLQQISHDLHPNACWNWRCKSF